LKMVKISLVCTLGVSPPVVTEFVRYMVDGEGLPVSDVTVVATDNPVVLSGLVLVKAALASRFPKIRFHEKILPFDDVRSLEETYMFINEMGRLLADQRRLHHVDAVHLSLAGGRKDMGITAALLASYFGVNGVYHVIMPEVQIVNEKLEALRREIENLASSGDPLSYYNRLKEEFDPVMYPPLGEYTVIKIPVIPYPLTMLRRIRRILTGEKLEKRAANLPDDVLIGLQASGLIRITSKGTVYATDLGRKVYDLLNWLEP